jgi:phage portal protein BeeE
MGIKSLFGFGQARDKPKDTVGNGYSFMFGRSTSGKPVNERTAMQTTAVYSCVRILAEAIASLPLHIDIYQQAEKSIYVIDDYVNAKTLQLLSQKQLNPMQIVTTD